MTRSARRRTADGGTRSLTRKLGKVGLDAQEYETLAASPLSRRSQEEEMKLAYLEERQPYCVHCERPLEQVRQLHYEDVLWSWSQKAEAFTRYQGDGDADKPYCVRCETGDWDYVDFRLVGF